MRYWYIFIVILFINTSYGCADFKNQISFLGSTIDGESKTKKSSDSLESLIKLNGVGTSVCHKYFFAHDHESFIKVLDFYEEGYYKEALALYPDLEAYPKVERTRDAFRLASAATFGISSIITLGVSGNLEVLFSLLKELRNEYHEEVKTYNNEEVLQKLSLEVKSDLKDRNVLVVTHDQGTDFMNQMIIDIKNDINYYDEYVKYRLGNLAVLQVAPFATINLATTDPEMHGDYILNDKDYLNNLIGYDLEPNYVMVKKSTSTMDIDDFDSDAHDFIAIYLNPSLGTGSGDNFKSMPDHFVDKYNNLYNKIQPVCSLGSNLEGGIFFSSFSSNESFVYIGLVDSSFPYNEVSLPDDYIVVYRDKDFTYADILTDSNGNMLKVNELNILNPDRFSFIASLDSEYDLFIIHKSDIFNHMERKETNCPSFELTAGSKFANLGFSNQYDSDYMDYEGLDKTITLSSIAPLNSVSFGGQFLYTSSCMCS
jgi:hypothetical protein